jgi:tetratricopeptide (TPR) repeat protein
MRHLGCLATLAAFSLSTGTAAANCQLQQLGSLAVDMHGLAPIVSARINGTEARFLLDTGAYYSILSEEAAAKYQLQVHSMPGSFFLRGAGGDQKARQTYVNSFEFIGVPAHNVQFLVIDTRFGDDYAGIFGQNLMRFSDVEYDLANGIVRLFKPVGCERQPLAYWAVSTPYTAIDLQYIDASEDHLRSTATINGKRMTVLLDTGATRSFLSLQAAERVGITPDSTGVRFLGSSEGGIGPGRNKVWSAPVDTFQLGGEKVEHTHLLIADLDPAHRIGETWDDMPDMLLGEDFFLSHRIYVAYSQRKVYFTYNGGPLFNLSLPEVAAAAPKSAASPGATAPANAATVEQPDADIPTDADGFRRRGMAYAATQEFDRALADLTHACELAPKDGDAYYDRGVVYARDRQFKPALQDFTTAITLQPDDIDARLTRADLLQSHPDTDPTAAPEIKTDLDAVARLAAPNADVRLQLGDMYGNLGDYPAAIDQIDQWLSTHSFPNDRIVGLNARCWWRAAGNRDLREALKDCNHALDLDYDDAAIRDSRGLVYLRLGNLDDARQDYDIALRASPKMSTSLYGRGLAELRLGRTAEGQADLAAAKKLNSGIAKRFSDMGLTP